MLCYFKERQRKQTFHYTFSTLLKIEVFYVDIFSTKKILPSDFLLVAAGTLSSGKLGRNLWLLPKEVNLSLVL